jgi:hypothetical protein
VRPVAFRQQKKGKLGWPGGERKQTVPCIRDSRVDSTTLPTTVPGTNQRAHLVAAISGFIPRPIPNTHSSPLATPPNISCPSFFSCTFYGPCSWGCTFRAVHCFLHGCLAPGLDFGGFGLPRIFRGYTMCRVWTWLACCRAPSHRPIPCLI